MQDRLQPQVADFALCRGIREIALAIALLPKISVRPPD
jgi:hypothetical protein